MSTQPYGEREGVNFERNSYSKGKASEMKIIVCIKQIPNPETPPSKFNIDPEAKKAIIPPGQESLVINPFDEQAVEASLQIKDNHGADVTALSLGGSSAKKILRHAMAMGADAGVLLQILGLEDHDSYSTALALSKAIKKIAKYDLIVCGRQAGDWDNGQVALGLAELLGIPSVTPVQRVQIVKGRVKVERVLPDGCEVLELPMPCLLAVSSEIGLPRLTTLRGIQIANKKDVTVWNGKDLGLESLEGNASIARTKILKLFKPVREARCFFIEGEGLEEAGINLALKLREHKII